MILDAGISGINIYQSFGPAPTCLRRAFLGKEHPLSLAVFHVNKITSSAEMYLLQHVLQIFSRVYFPFHLTPRTPLLLSDPAADGINKKWWWHPKTGKLMLENERCVPIASGRLCSYFHFAFQNSYFLLWYGSLGMAAWVIRLNG